MSRRICVGIDFCKTTWKNFVRDNIEKRGACQLLRSPCFQGCDREGKTFQFIEDFG